MSSYSIPGVYRQDVYPVSDPVFLTGVPVFLGSASSGPINEPQRLDLWPQFEPLFGAASEASYLASAVRGFFENDGLICYVVRLDDGISALEALRTGLTATTHLEDVDLVCVPDLTVRPTNVADEDYHAALVTLQQEILAHCQLLGNRFAILDTPLTSEYDIVHAQRDQLNSSYGALYYPWVLVSDGATGSRYVPPCGHVAGVYAKSDQQVGAHKAPANEVMEGILGLSTSLSPAVQAELYANQINYLRAFTGRGIRVWGARTLSRETEWQHINVRRLFLTIGRWLELFMTELPFEPNNSELWVRIVREVSNYLNDIFQQGMLKGQRADQAFYVKCDAEINTAEVRDLGQVITEIGIAPAMPSEFIVVRVIHGASGVSVTTS